MQSLFEDVITHITPDNFALRAFNRFAYNQEISVFLLARHWVGLLNYYTLSNHVKSINLAIFRKCFSKFTPHIYKPRSDIHDFLRLRHSTLTPSTMFDYYCCKGSKYENFCLFVHICVISIYSQKLANSSNIKFEFSHSRHQIYV